jgi:hypothetical protein
MDWLSRYRSGAREAVWAEMAAEGELSGERREQAALVAKETMRRARVSLTKLAERLAASGYVFLHPDEILVPPSADLPNHLRTLEKEAGPIPIALRAFWEEVGSVNFIGAHPEWPLPAFSGLEGFPEPKSTHPKDLLYADPIVVASVEHNLTEYEESYAYQIEQGEIDPEDEPFEFLIAPCALHKANVSGSQQTVRPGAVADPDLLGLYTGPSTFVSYLRGAIAAAGFAGFAHRPNPKERRALLEWAEGIAEGLEPI